MGIKALLNRKYEKRGNFHLDSNGRAVGVGSVSVGQVVEINSRVAATGSAGPDIGRAEFGSTYHESGGRGPHVVQEHWAPDPTAEDGLRRQPTVYRTDTRHPMAPPPELVGPDRPVTPLLQPPQPPK